jgi:hypothetical protein
MSTLRTLLLAEAIAFAAAASTHLGMLFEGYRHQAAGTAESVIAAVLLAGLALSFSPPPWGGLAFLVSQGFATLGTLVGAFTIAIGIGPRTPLDLVFHGAILIVLFVGLWLGWRAAPLRIQGAT